MRLFLGVDGGASATRAVIGDDSGRVLATAEGSPSNHVAAAEGRERLLRALRESVGAACRLLDLDLANTVFEAAFLGLTGGESGKRPIVEEVIRARKLALSDDSQIAFVGALGGRAGVVTIAGTGSISFGRNDRGETARAGGWGYAFGDEGSGYDLTRQALRAALRFEEGWGPPTVLHNMLCRTVGLEDIRLVQRKLYGADYSRDQIAGLSRLVDEAAQLRDPVALRILKTGARQLAKITRIVRNRLFPRNECVTISYVGGVFRSEVLLSEFMRLLTVNRFHRIIPPAYEPAVGALIAACWLAGKTVSISV